MRERLKQTGLPWERKKLDFGDYSIRCTLPDGGSLDLSSRVAVERKMNLNELCSCFCYERSRFVREFQRAQTAGAKLYLLVENASWEQAYAGDYRSNMTPQSLTASLIAWMARYPCQILTCRPETSGRLIRDILWRELKEHLENIDAAKAEADEGRGR